MLILLNFRHVELAFLCNETIYCRESYIKRTLEIHLHYKLKLFETHASIIEKLEANFLQKS